MTTDDLIRDLCSWVRTLPKPKNESELHAEVLRKLETMELSPKNKPRIENVAANGASYPDMLVTSVSPQLLIEIEANGEWRHVSEAAWQLFQAGELLQDQGFKTRKLAIFGGELTDPLLRKMLETLSIEWGCVQD